MVKRFWRCVTPRAGGPQICIRCVISTWQREQMAHEAWGHGDEDSEAGNHIDSTGALRKSSSVRAQDGGASGARVSQA